jgi:hypothetical protein
MEVKTLKILELEIEIKKLYSIDMDLKLVKLDLLLELLKELQKKIT